VKKRTPCLVGERAGLPKGDCSGRGGENPEKKGWSSRKEQRRAVQRGVQIVFHGGGVIEEGGGDTDGC